jgi:hypothetical protein
MLAFDMKLQGSFISQSGDRVQESGFCWGSRRSDPGLMGRERVPDRELRSGGPEPSSWAVGREWVPDRELRSGEQEPSVKGIERGRVLERE